MEPVINVYPPAGTPGWVNGLFILLGAVAGGGIAMFTSWLSDKRKLGHETERQWDKDIRQLAERAVLLGRDLCNTQFADDKIKDVDGFVAHVQESVKIETQLRLTASNAIVDSYRDLYDAAIKVGVNGNIESQRKEAEGYRTNYQSTEADFVAAVRDALRVKG